MRYTLKTTNLTQDERRRLEVAAARSGYPLEAVVLVAVALGAACRGCPPGKAPDPKAPATHRPAAAVCSAVCDYARSLCGESAFDALRFWHLRHGEDIGRIVYALTEEELAKASESDSLDDFRGISVIRVLYPEAP